MLQENKHYTPCVRTTTISNLISKNNCTSLKFHLPQPRFFHHARKKEIAHHACVKNNLQSYFQEKMNQFKVQTASSTNFLSQNKSNSAHHACVTKQSSVLFLRIIAPAQNSNCLKHKFSITKQVKQCISCVPSKTIRNPIDQPRIFHYEGKQTVHSMCAKEHLYKALNSKCLKQEFFKNNCTSSKFRLPEPRIFHLARKQILHTMRA